MTEFSKLWDYEVKQLAQACVTEPRLVGLMMKDENYQFTDEEKEYINEVYKRYKDPYGMFYVSDMIWRVEHALSDGRDSAAKLAILQIHGALDSSDYLKNVFKGDSSSEEYKNMMKLRDGLAKLMRC